MMSPKESSPARLRAQKWSLEINAQDIIYEDEINQEIEDERLAYEADEESLKLQRKTQEILLNVFKQTFKVYKIREEKRAEINTLYNQYQLELHNYLSMYIMDETVDFTMFKRLIQEPLLVLLLNNYDIGLISFTNIWKTYGIYFEQAGISRKQGENMCKKLLKDFESKEYIQAL